MKTSKLIFSRQLCLWQQNISAPCLVFGMMELGCIKAKLLQLIAFLSSIQSHSSFKHLRAEMLMACHISRPQIQLCAESTQLKVMLLPHSLAQRLIQMK